MLAGVASQCEPAFGAMGRTGFLYDSAKDQLRWHDLSAKNHVRTIMRIGEVMALSDEDYESSLEPEMSSLTGQALEDYLFGIF